MKTSLRKLRGFALRHADHKDRRDLRPLAPIDELAQASQVHPLSYLCFLTNFMKTEFELFPTTHSLLFSTNCLATKLKVSALTLCQAKEGTKIFLEFLVRFFFFKMAESGFCNLLRH